jgi:hypothetical protein
LTTGHQGRGVFVADQAALRRLSTDIAEGRGFYSMLDRTGRELDTVTTVTAGRPARRSPMGSASPPARRS